MRRRELGRWSSSAQAALAQRLLTGIAQDAGRFGAADTCRLLEPGMNQATDQGDSELNPSEQRCNEGYQEPYQK